MQTRRLTRIAVLAANYYVFLPRFGAPPEMTWAILPFNLFKGAASGGITCVFYQQIERLVAEKEGARI